MIMTKILIADYSLGIVIVIY